MTILVQELRAEIERLQVENAELRRDAERYRAFFDAGLPITFLGQDCYDKASLDAVIDQAMTKEQP